MKQFIHKRRKSDGLKRYVAPMGYTRTSMQWGKWETVAKYNTLLEAADALKETKDIKNIVGSTQNKIVWDGRDIVWEDSDWWARVKNKLERPGFRNQLQRFGEAIRQALTEFDWRWDA